MNHPMSNTELILMLGLGQIALAVAAASVRREVVVVAAAVGGLIGALAALLILAR